MIKENEFVDKNGKVNTETLGAELWENLVSDVRRDSNTLIEDMCRIAKELLDNDDIAVHVEEVSLSLDDWFRYYRIYTDDMKERNEAFWVCSEVDFAEQEDELITDFKTEEWEGKSSSAADSNSSDASSSSSENYSYLVGRKNGEIPEGPEDEVDEFGNPYGY